MARGAACGDPILRVHRLERALELAHAHGIRDEAAELRAELARIGPEDLGLTAIRASLSSLPRRSRVPRQLHRRAAPGPLRLRP